MKKNTKARVAIQAFDSYVGWARGRKVSLRDEKQAGEWMEFMVANGFKVHEQSKVQPSGSMPIGVALWICEEGLARILKDHPNKGKTPEQIMEEAAQRRAESCRWQYESEEDRKESRNLEMQKLHDDEKAIFSLLFSYNSTNPFSPQKFSEDLAKLGEGDNCGK